jgi:hypothetical protein
MSLAASSLGLMATSVAPFSINPQAAEYVAHTTTVC